MCFSLYIAANHPLATTASREESETGFHAIHLEEGEIKVREILGCERVVYAGTREGCGCYFLHESQEDFARSQASLPADARDLKQSAAKDREERITQVVALKSYLREALCDGPVDVLAAWGEPKRPQSTVTVSLDAFGGSDGFALIEDCLYRIR
jgi:hypothetical protein